MIYIILPFLYYLLAVIVETINLILLIIVFIATAKLKLFIIKVCTTNRSIAVTFLSPKKLDEAEKSRYKTEYNYPNMFVWAKVESKRIKKIIE